MSQQEPQLVIFQMGKLVYLRPFEENDLPSLTQLANDPEVNEFFIHQRPVAEITERRRLEKRMSDESGNVYLAIALVEGNNNKLAGSINLHRVDLVHGTAWLEIRLCPQEYWGKGYGSEAIMLLLDHAFNRLNLRKVCWGTFGTNARGIACAKKCGFAEDGRMKAQFERNGQFIDDVHLSVFREDWIPKREEYQSSWNKG